MIPFRTMTGHFEAILFYYSDHSFTCSPPGIRKATWRLVVLEGLILGSFRLENFFLFYFIFLSF